MTRFADAITRWSRRRRTPVEMCSRAWPAGAVAGVLVRCDLPAGHVVNGPTMCGGPMPPVEQLPPSLAGWAATYRQHMGAGADRLQWTNPGAPVMVHDIHGSRLHQPGEFLRLDGGTLDVGSIPPLDEHERAAFVEAAGLSGADVRFVPVDPWPDVPECAAGRGTVRCVTGGPSCPQCDGGHGHDWQRGAPRSGRTPIRCVTCGARRCDRIGCTLRRHHRVHADGTGHVYDDQGFLDMLAATAPADGPEVHRPRWCVGCGIERPDVETDGDGGYLWADRCPACGDDRPPEAGTSSWGRIEQARTTGTWSEIRHVDTGPLARPDEPGT